MTDSAACAHCHDPDHTTAGHALLAQVPATKPKHVNLAGRWRVGRKVGRTIYAQQGPEPSDDDPLIGIMDYPTLAALAVKGHNASLNYEEDA